MKISIIGTGNVATVLARLIKQSAHTIHQIIARHTDAGDILAAEVGATCIHINEQADANIDLVIIALTDNALVEAMSGIYFGEVPVVHTAGAMSMNDIARNSVNFGVLYPLQSLRKEMQTIPTIPFLIEANNEKTLSTIEVFAKTLSDNVQEVNEEKRLRLHVAAVIVNNFTNYLYTVADDFCTQESVGFNLLKPMIKETADRIQNNDPHNLQTGPAKRGDIITLSKHLRVLETHPKLRVLYTRMTDGIMNG
jgi:predicted short-subunit dehydrogenase-like oxidoreductase (DUF2520 family)